MVTMAHRLPARRLVVTATWLVGALCALLAAYLVFAVLSHRASVIASTPAARAVGELTKAVRGSPNDLSLRLQLAQALTVAGRDVEAVDQYQAALKIRPNDPSALAGLGFLAMTRREWSTAEGYWRAVVEELSAASNPGGDQNMEKAFFYLGTSLMEQRDYRQAVAYFKEALRIKRDAADTHYALAFCYKQLDSKQKYREELEAALAFDPVMPEANYDLAMLLLEDGDVAGAAEHLRVSADAAPGVEKPWQALQDLGDPQKRLAAAESLAKTDPKKALIEARVAVAIEPDNAEGLRMLAGLYERAGAKDEAVAVWERLLIVSPGDADAVAAVERLTSK